MQVHTYTLCTLQITYHIRTLHMWLTDVYVNVYTGQEMKKGIYRRKNPLVTFLSWVICRCNIFMNKHLFLLLLLLVHSTWHTVHSSHSVHGQCNPVWHGMVWYGYSQREQVDMYIIAHTQRVTTWTFVIITKTKTRRPKYFCIHTLKTQVSGLKISHLHITHYTLLLFLLLLITCIHITH